MKFRARAVLACALFVPAGLAVMCAQQPLPALQGDVAFTHDPSLIQAGSTYYVFATGKAPEGGQLPIRCSDDMVHWRHCGHVFDELPAWIQAKSPGTKDLWAPDISFEHGEYRLYYAYSLFGKNASGIGLVVNKTLDPTNPAYHWQDRGLVLASTAHDDFNAIDPNYIEDRKGHAWLAFGSFWSGIKMRSLDAATGMANSADTKTYALAARPVQSAPGNDGLPPDWQAIEAPFVFQHGRYFYLFVAFDLCCRGVHSTYHTMVGRSHSVTGPYLDEDGRPMLAGGGTQLLGPGKHWLGPGGASVVRLKDGRDVIVFHAYDATTGRPALKMTWLTWKDGWPVATPWDE